MNVKDVSKVGGFDECMGSIKKISFEINYGAIMQFKEKNMSTEANLVEWLEMSTTTR